MVTTNVNLNLAQLEYLRGILFEYYANTDYMCDNEAELHCQVEQILAQHSNKLFG